MIEIPGGRLVMAGYARALKGSPSPPVRAARVQVQGSGGFRVWAGIPPRPARFEASDGLLNSYFVIAGQSVGRHRLNAIPLAP